MGLWMVVLTEESRTTLLDAVKPIHKKVYAQHVTLALTGRSDKRNETYGKLEGKEVEITVTGLAKDKAGQAVVVERTEQLPPCVNEVPHITISCKEGTQPKYSNKLLSFAYIKPIEPPLHLTGTVAKGK